MTANSECRLAGGRAVVLRRGRPRRRRAVIALYLELPPRSCYLRFAASGLGPRGWRGLASIGSGTICLVALRQPIRN